MFLSMPSIARFVVRSAPIISALLVTLSVVGCSAVRLGYNSAPMLAYWWLDGYFDFDDQQSLRIKADLQAARDWHRTDELPLLIQTLKDLQTMAPKPVTQPQVCQMVASLLVRIQAPLDRLAPSIATIAPTLQATQVDHITTEFAKRDKKWRAEWLEGTPTERTERRVKQIVERAESFYGTLEPAQIALVKMHIEASSFNGPRQHQEMLRRQQDSIQVLNTLRTTRVPAAQATADIRHLLERSLKAPDPAYRQYIEQITNESCATIADLHNSSTSAQRVHLVKTLRDYEGDARSLLNQVSQGPIAAAASAPLSR